jgi:hypothetical protein
VPNLPKRVTCWCGATDYSCEHTKRVATQASTPTAPMQTEALKQRAPAYGTNHWRVFSKLLRAHNPLCQLCNRVASQLVHHIFPIEQFPQWQYHVYVVHEGQRRMNCVCLCKACHSPSLTTATFTPTVEPNPTV